jgi:type VI protein secretion system component Hcp
MRKVLFASLLVFSAASLFADSSPCLTISGISGEAMAPCAGDVAFASANYSTSQRTLHVTRYFDSSSPKLMNDCSMGTHLMSVSLAYPQMQTDGSTKTITVKFKDVLVTTVNESVNPTNETADFKYSSWEIISGGGNVQSGNVLGSARASTMNVAVIGSDGKPTAATHLSLTVRPGGTTFNSVQLNPQPLPPRTGVQARMVKMNPAALNLGNGVIELRGGRGGVTRFQFTGGTLLNGNLRVSRAAFTGGVRPQ